jgi:hypothetical protein
MRKPEIIGYAEAVDPSDMTLDLPQNVVEALNRPGMPIIRPQGDNLVAAVNAWLPVLNGLFQTANATRQHPEPLMIAMMIVVGNFVDITAPPHGGDLLAENLCHQMRANIAVIRQQAALSRENVGDGQVGV